MEYRSLASLGLDVRLADYFAPLLGFFDDVLAEVDGRAGEWGLAKIGKPRLYLGVGEGGIDLAVEFANDLRGRVLGRDDAKPIACLVAWDELAHGRGVRKRLLAHRGGDG